MFKEFIDSKNDFLKAAIRAYDCGLQTGTGGNVSTRIPLTEYMLVKPSGVSFMNCSENNLVVTDYYGRPVEEGKPTRESYLHGLIYKNFSHIGGIVHTHSVWSILVSKHYDQLPLITKHSGLKMNKAIPILDVKGAAVGEDEGHIVLKAFEDNKDLSVFILRDHGIVAFSETAQKACEIAELVEETAQIFYNNMIFNK